MQIDSTKLQRHKDVEVDRKGWGAESACLLSMLEALGFDLEKKLYGQRLMNRTIVLWGRLECCRSRGYLWST